MDMWSSSQPSHFTLGEKTLVAIKAWTEPKASVDNFKPHKRQTAQHKRPVYIKRWHNKEQMVISHLTMQLKYRQH
jgi:hypothetical protein